MRRLFEAAAIAGAVAAIAILLAPSCNAPRVTIRGPSSPVVLDGHGDLELAVVVTGTVGRVAVELDGAGAREPVVVDPPLPAGGDCDGGCAIAVRWDADEARAGAHDLAVVAYDARGRRGDAHVALDVRDHVVADLMRPAAADLRGVHTVTAVVHARYRGAVRGALALDRADGADAAAARIAPDCRGGCDLMWRLDLSAVAAGAHRIAWLVTDEGGHVAHGELPIVVGDVPWLSTIRVTGEHDGPGTKLEIEAHLEDAATGADLGCTGQAQGMELVDQDDTDYDVRAWFVHPDGTTLGIDELAGRRVRVHVIEDDSRPCPGPIDPDDDDLGRSAAVAPDALPSVRGGFGEVVDLRLQIGRPLRQ